MTDALMDRIKAHRSAPDVYDPPTFDQMADRIDELMESNKELTRQLMAALTAYRKSWWRSKDEGHHDHKL